MDAAIPADAQNAPTGIWKSRTEREIPTAPTPIIVVVNERKNNGDSHSVAKPSTESDQAQPSNQPSQEHNLLSRLATVTGVQLHDPGSSTAPIVRDGLLL